MTQDEIIRMAREACAPNQTFNSDEEWVKRFAALVAVHEAEKWKAENKRDYENWKMAAEKAAECERESCAKVCEDLIAKGYQLEGELDLCAAAIRARSK